MQTTRARPVATTLWVLTAALLGNLAVTLVLALVLPLPEGEPMALEESIAFLEVALTPWLSATAVDIAEGTVSHKALERRVFVRGVLSNPERTVVASHVLKIGWPFTTLRGFVHVIGEQTFANGAVGIRGDLRDGFVHFIPLRPVWPGIIFNTLILALVLVASVFVTRRMLREAP